MLAVATHVVGLQPKNSIAPRVSKLEEPPSDGKDGASVPRKTAEQCEKETMAAMETVADRRKEEQAERKAASIAKKKKSRE